MKFLIDKENEPLDQNLTNVEFLAQLKLEYNFYRNFMEGLITFSLGFSLFYFIIL